MITIKEGSHSFFLLRILSVAGEIPQYSLDIMGSEQTYNIIKDAFDNLIFDNILTEKYMVKENG